MATYCVALTSNGTRGQMGSNINMPNESAYLTKTNYYTIMETNLTSFIWYITLCGGSIKEQPGRNTVATYILKVAL
jgi:hypothetical protein